MRWQLVLLAALLAPAAAHGRQWVDNTGTFTAEAEFIRIEKDSVQLQLAGGVRSLVPWRRLSEADQKYLAEIGPRLGAAQRNAIERLISSEATDSRRLEKPEPSPADVGSSLVRLAVFSALRPGPPAQAAEAAPHFKSVLSGQRSTFHILGASGTVLYWAPGGAHHYGSHTLARVEETRGPNSKQFRYYNNINGDPIVKQWAIRRQPDYCNRYSVWYSTGNNNTQWRKYDQAWRELPK